MSSFLESLFKTPKIYGIQVSPDYKWVAWSWKNIGPVVQIFIAPTDGSVEPVVYTNAHQDVFVHSWSADSMKLVVGHDTDGDEFVRLFLLELGKPGAMKLLTDLVPTYFVRGGMLDSTGRYLIYAANFDFGTNAVVDPFVVYRQDLVSGEKKVLATQKVA